MQQQWDAPSEETRTALQQQGATTTGSGPIPITKQTATVEVPINLPGQDRPTVPAPSATQSSSVQAMRFQLDNLVFVGMHGFIAAIDTDKQGEEVWRVGMSLSGVTTLRFDQGLLFGACGRHLFALQPQSGKVEWDNNLPDLTFTHTCLASNRAMFPRNTRPEEAGQERKIFLGTAGHVLCIRQATGMELWRKELPNVGTNLVTVLYEGKRIFAGSNGLLFALDSETGEILWENGLSGLGYQVICCGTDLVSMNYAWDPVPQIAQEASERVA
jgi:glucose dehydrogenase